MNDEVNAARVVLQQHVKELLTRSNVVATGIGFKHTAGRQLETPCIVCSVEKKLSLSKLSTKDIIPKAYDGLPTDVIETGPIRAFQNPTDRFRPAPGGVSIGHRDITAGTLGCWVRKNEQWVILSNNHVLANSNDANIGDPILQPGPHDGGRFPDDHIAVLEQFIPIEFSELPSECSIATGLASVLNGLASAGGSHARLKAVSRRAGENRVDAAIARPLSQEDVAAEILNIGPIQGTVPAELGMGIKKSGRTTGYTEDSIQQVDVTVNVQYGAGRIATFTDQLLAGPMSQGGDSGSAVLDSQNKLTGLLFAGSDQSTIINRIENVFDALDLTL